MRAIFLDRDGVVIRKAPNGEYISDWQEVEILAGSLEAIAEFCRAGYKIFFITNQRGIALRKLSLASLNEIHAKLRDAIQCAGGVLSGTYFCPHDYSDNCSCRKPKPGMLISAAADHELELDACWMVGDTVTDIMAGRSAGCKTALITTSEQDRLGSVKPDLYAESLALVAKRMLSKI